MTSKSTSERILWTKVHSQMGTDALPWPTRKTAQAAGYDCVAAIDEPLELWPGRLVKVPLGFALALPEGLEAQIRPRSGLASQGLMMPNSPGTVDADYRGEVSALFFLAEQRWSPPASTEAIQVSKKGWMVIKPGDRVCQMVICALPRVSFQVADQLPKTERGSGGFGSTGR